jgi:hypothetical protein
MITQGGACPRLSHPPLMSLASLDDRDVAEHFLKKAKGCIVYAITCGMTIHEIKQLKHISNDMISISCRLKEWGDQIIDDREAPTYICKLMQLTDKAENIVFVWKKKQRLIVKKEATKFLISDIVIHVLLKYL